jgi:PhnB protein
MAGFVKKLGPRAALLTGPNFYNTLPADFGENVGMQTVKAIPEGYHSVTPYLVVPDAAREIEFLKQAFAATEVFRHSRPDGSIAHAEVRIGDSMVMLGQAGGDWEPMPCGIYLYVENVDAVYPKALEAGAKSQSEPKTQFYGDRVCDVIDPAGNHWWIGTHVEDVTSEEIERRQASMAAS